MRKIRFGLSVWPSVYLRFSWRYELVVWGVKEREERERERSGASLKAPDGWAGLQRRSPPSSKTPLSGGYGRCDAMHEGVWLWLWVCVEVRDKLPENVFMSSLCACHHCKIRHHITCIQRWMLMAWMLHLCRRLLSCQMNRKVFQRCKHLGSQGPAVVHLSPSSRCRKAAAQSDRALCNLSSLKKKKREKNE